MAFLDDWSKALSDIPQEGIPWYALRGSPSTDDDERMMLGHYEILERAPLAGGYTLSFDTSLDGDLNLFVAMPAVSLDVPSVVRMGDNLILTGSHWDATALVPLVEGDFDGRVLANGDLHVDFYVNVNPNEGWKTWRLVDDIVLRNTLRQ